MVGYINLNFAPIGPHMFNSCFGKTSWKELTKFDSLPQTVECCSNLHLRVDSKLTGMKQSIHDTHKAISSYTQCLFKIYTDKVAQIYFKYGVLLGLIKRKGYLTSEFTLYGLSQGHIERYGTATEDNFQSRVKAKNQNILSIRLITSGYMSRIRGSLEVILV